VFDGNTEAIALAILEEIVFENSFVFTFVANHQTCAQKPSENDETTRNTNHRWLDVGKSFFALISAKFITVAVKRISY